jgi:hypothetical protein
MRIHFAFQEQMGTQLTIESTVTPSPTAQRALSKGYNPLLVRGNWALPFIIMMLPREHQSSARQIMYRPGIGTHHAKVNRSTKWLSTLAYTFQVLPYPEIAIQLL